MDKDLVLVRSAAGEAAVSQPTRIVQRHLRMALMLVDGEHRVADVIARFGDIAVGEAALADLQRMGLIETAEACAQRNAAACATHPASEAAIAAKFLPSQVTDTDPRAATGVVETITIDDVEESHRPLRPLPASPAAPTHARKATPQRTLYPVSGHAPAAPRGAARQARPVQRPAKRRSGMWSALALLLLLLLGAVAGLRYYPYERHLPQIEQRLSAALGEPVTIGRLRISLTPHPSIALDDVRIGSERPITVSAVRFLPDPLTLAGSRPAIRRLQLDGLDVPAGDVQRLAGLLLAAASNPAFDVRGLRFSDLTLRFGGTVLSGLRGETSDAVPARMRFTTADDALQGEVAQTAEGLRLRLQSHAPWAPAFLAPLAFDRFEAEGPLGEDGLRLDKVYARLADGAVTGRARVGLGADTQISAELEMKHVSLHKLLALSQADVLAQGSASGTLKLGTATAKPESGRSLVFEGSINVQNGAVQGFDLVEAVRSTNRAAVRGGATRFEEFAAQVRVDGGTWRISRLRLESGLLSAEGQLSGGRDRHVAGLVNVELRGSGGSVRVPVAVTGSLRDPVLSASRGAKAAAAPEPS